MPVLVIYQNIMSWHFHIRASPTYVPLNIIYLCLSPVNIIFKLGVVCSATKYVNVICVKFFKKKSNELYTSSLPFSITKLE
jgi:hypothetical protein